ncbi:hypothetical protein GCM10008938_01030 [Deinococcus roseus]|uniref:ATP-grasp domain-containing protein n=2 Tax=Deinococcus roseus TaxID=392414 RepID=A0ABQ2CTI0_9DEIO|nr:hypothetical protein GCM10008938_01030 [Deinococcus roseus]
MTLYCLVLAQLLNLQLVSPAEDFLVRVDSRWLKRKVWSNTIRDLQPTDFPLFAKSAVPKLFRSGVFQTLADLKQECTGLEPDTQLMCSEVVSFLAEARVFVLQGRLMTCAIYEGEGSLEDFQESIQPFLWEHQLPETCTADFGFIPERGWALIELNPTWGAGLNGCDPGAVSLCLEHACFPIQNPL